MRTHSTNEGSVFELPDYKTHWILTIGGVLTDDILISGSVEINVGQPVQTATFTMHLGKGARSISPFLSTSLRNPLFHGAPAVDLGQPISLYTSTYPPGEDYLPYLRKQFTGYIDDIDMDPSQDTLTVKCRDIFGQPVQDLWIDQLTEQADGWQYGFSMSAGRVDVVMQTLMDLATSGTGPTIVVEGIPDLNLSEYRQEQMGLLEALRRIGTTNGWDLRGKWDRTAIDSYDLFYYKPDREKHASDAIFIGEVPKYYSVKFSSSIANIRNVCDVIASGNDARIPKRSQDDLSIAAYGRRFAGLSEDLSSHIDTDQEAQDLADIMVDDLSTAPVGVELEMPYYWLLEINDLFKILPDNFSYDADNLYVVSGIVHTLAEGGEATTRLSGSLAARSAIREWLRGRKRLNQVRLGPPAGPGLEGDVWFQVDDLTLPS